MGKLQFINWGDDVERGWYTVDEAGGGEENHLDGGKVVGATPVDADLGRGPERVSAACRRRAVSE